jgi:hypothetical protein
VDAYIGYADIIGDCAVCKGGVVNACWFFKAVRKLYAACESTELNGAEKLNVYQPIRVETIGDFNQTPIISGTALRLKDFYLLFR